MFKDNYREIYDQVTPDKQLISATLELKRVSQTNKPKRSIKFITVPVGAVASVLIAFTLLVNLSPAFAHAVEPIPVLREIAVIVNFSPLRKAVDYSPSLSAAVDNEYVQFIGQEQTKGDITLRIEYVIIDEQQLNIFYTLLSDLYTELFVTDVALYNTSGSPLEGYSIQHPRSFQGFWDGDIGQNDMRQLIVMFSDTVIPDNLVLQCNVIDLKDSNFETIDEESSAFTTIGYLVPISDFSLPFSFDSKLISKTETIGVNQTFTIDGQGITIKSIELSPTHTKINITPNYFNTAWLLSMTCYLIDENGNVFNQTGYCLDTSYSDKDVYYLESLFFTESQNLTLVVTDAVWLDKNTELTKIDLVNRTGENLPLETTLIHIGVFDDSSALSFSSPNREPAFYDPFFYDMGRHMYALFNHGFYDEFGNMYYFSSGGQLSERYEIWDSPEYWKAVMSPEEFDSLVKSEEILAQQIPGYRQGLPVYYEQFETPGWFGTVYFLTDYPYDTLYLRPAFTHISNLDTPVEITIR